MTKPEKTGEEQEIRDDKGRFLPGISGNPLGKPVGSKHLTTKLWEALQEVARTKTGELDPEGKKWADKFVERMLIETIAKGNPTLMKEVLDRVDGKVDQGIVLGGGLTAQHSEEAVMEIARRVSDELKQKKTIQ
jgi:hypothetical protein